jgi:hypothetical protein
MKLLIVITLLAFASPTFGQSQSSSAPAVPGCGPANIEFNVKTDDNHHPAIKPEPGKAILYFLQDDAEFQSNPRPTTRFGVDGIWVGATHSNSYFFVSVSPGEHHFCASWQGLVGAFFQRREAALHFTAEAGMSYYFQAKNLYEPQTQKTAIVLLKPLDSDEGELLMSQFSFSTSNPKK